MLLAMSACDADKESRRQGDENGRARDEADETEGDAASLESQKEGSDERGRSQRRAPNKTKRRPKSLLLAQVRELTGWRVADGFLPREQIIEVAMIAADDRQSLRAEVENIVDDELAAHRKRESEWRYWTDADRLTRAFLALEKQGIIAHERFADCRSCALADMKVLREDFIESGRRAEGYVFFTDQDADGVSERGELVLEFGSFEDDEKMARSVGERIQHALRAAGLRVVAEEDQGEQYLVLTDLQWQKRRFSRPPTR